MKTVTFLILFFCHVVFGIKAEDDNLSHIDEDMIMVMAGGTMYLPNPEI
jgi:hypothetical protein